MVVFGVGIGPLSKKLSALMINDHGYHCKTSFLNLISYILPNKNLKDLMKHVVNHYSKA